MISHTTRRFRQSFRALPAPVRRQVRAAYERFRQNPNHPSLHFKPIHASRPIYSVRIGLGYRAVGILQDAEIVWFWIGSHANYDRLVSQL